MSYVIIVSLEANSRHWIEREELVRKRVICTRTFQAGVGHKVPRGAVGRESEKLVVNNNPESTP